MTTTGRGRLDPQRLAAVQLVELARGHHTGPADGACLMEAAAYLAGETWSDAPDCASDVVAGLLRTWNDLLPARPRQELRRYLPRIVASRGTPAQETERAALAAWWLTQGPGALVRGRARAVVEAAVTVAIYHAPGPPPEAPRTLPDPPRRVPRPVLDAMHDLIDRLLAITETPTDPAPVVVERPKRVSRPARRRGTRTPRRRPLPDPTMSTPTELPE